jgi:hypothetical protein
MSIVEELSSCLKEATTQIASLKTTVHTLRIENAKLLRESQMKEAGLSPEAIKRLHEAFANSTDNAGLKQAINVEKRGGQ